MRNAYKRCYKICICSVILGELEGFPNCKGFSVIFPTISARLEITAGQPTMSRLIVELTGAANDCFLLNICLEK